MELGTFGLSVRRKKQPFFVRFISHVEKFSDTKSSVMSNGCLKISIKNIFILVLQYCKIHSL